MPHYDHTLFCNDKLPECLSLDTGFHTRISGSLFTFSAIISNSFAIFYNCLITTTGKSQINCNAGIVIPRRICVLAQSQSDTERSRNLISNIYVLHIVQKREPVRFHPIETFLLNYNKILIFLQLLCNTIQICNILVDLTVDQSHQKRLTNLFHTLHHFIIIIDVNQSGNKALFLIFTNISIQFGYILQMNCNEIFLLFRKFQQLFRFIKILHRYILDFCLIILVLVTEFQIDRLPFFLRESTSVQFRNISAQIRIFSLFFSQHIVKLCIGPDNLTITLQYCIWYRQFL